jgi:hypothetical protein
LKKIPDRNIYKKKMEDLFTAGHPKLSIDNFRNTFMRVRESACMAISEATEYGCTPPPSTKSYKTKFSDPMYNQKCATDTVHRDSKRPKSENSTPIFDPINHCWICGMNNHLKGTCYLTKTQHPDRNTEDKPFHLSTKGKLWQAVQANSLGPIVRNNTLLNGDRYIKKFDTKPPAQSTHCKYSYNASILANNSQLNSHSDNTSHSDTNPPTTDPNFLTFLISLPPTQMATAHQAEDVEGAMEEEGPHLAEDGVADTVTRVRSNNVRNVRSNNVSSISVQALLDSGCLAGDYMSYKFVDKLDAAHLLLDLNTTICSGFDNTCFDKFKSLLINISFLNEITFL